jgi:hypothetical protein
MHDHWNLTINWLYDMLDVGMPLYATLDALYVTYCKSCYIYRMSTEWNHCLCLF